MDSENPKQKMCFQCGDSIKKEFSAYNLIFCSTTCVKGFRKIISDEEEKKKKPEVSNISFSYGHGPACC